MICNEVKYQLPDFIKSRLSEEEHQQIAEHLKQCLICKSELASIEVTFKKFDREYIAEPSSTYWNNLLPRIHNRIEESTKPKYTEWIVRTSIPAMATVAAIFLVIKVFQFDGATIQQQVTTNENIESLIYSLNENEIADLELRFSNVNDFNSIKKFLDSTSVNEGNSYLYQSLHSLDEKEMDDLLAILETTE
ncbi:MAG: zf-HC2 domain-containing protein [Bacteroidota bacterium]|nr:zf-HC2 domain-containing protein [Bacteroidota bacterium]